MKCLRSLDLKHLLKQWYSDFFYDSTGDGHRNCNGEELLMKGQRRRKVYKIGGTLKATIIKFINTFPQNLLHS